MGFEVPMMVDLEGFSYLRQEGQGLLLGIWGREFAQAYTPGMTGMDRWIAFEKQGFIGCDAARAEKDRKSRSQQLVTLEVDAENAEASGFEPVWQDGKRVGFITSGGYGHSVQKSLAMALLPPPLAEPGTELTTHVVGVERGARVIKASPHDPEGARMRA